MYTASLPGGRIWRNDALPQIHHDPRSGWACPVSRDVAREPSRFNSHALCWAILTVVLGGRRGARSLAEANGEANPASHPNAIDSVDRLAVQRARTIDARRMSWTQLEACPTDESIEATPVCWGE